VLTGGRRGSASPGRERPRRRGPARRRRNGPGTRRRPLPSTRRASLSTRSRPAAPSRVHPKASTTMFDVSFGACAINHCRSSIGRSGVGVSPAAHRRGRAESKYQHLGQESSGERWTTLRWPRSKRSGRSWCRTACSASGHAGIPHTCSCSHRGANAAAAVPAAAEARTMVHAPGPSGVHPKK